MAGDNTRETESRGEGSQTQEENRQTRSESSERERSSQQQQNNNATNHQIPLYPLPPPLAARPSMLPPLSHGLGYNPFNSDPFRSERPYDPKWHLAKLILLGSSLVSSAIIIGVCLAMGLMNSQHYGTDLWYQPIDYVFGTSATAAGLAIFITTLELFITARSSRRQGMHPGLLIALHLFIWIMCIPANFVAGVYAVYPERPTWRYYDVYKDRESARQLDNLFAKTSACLRTVFAFDLILIVLHFVLFVRACVETHRINRARRNRRRQTVLVPVMQAPPPAAAAGFPAAAVPRMGAYPPYPHPHQPLPPHYPYYPAPPPAAAPVSAPYPPPKGVAPAPAPVPPPAAAVPPAASRSPVPTPTPTPPPPAAVYGGYYGPAPAPAPVPPQQQQPYPNYAAYAGYYAPMQLPTQPMMAGGNRRHSSSSSSSRNNRRSSQRRSSRTAAESAEPPSTEKPSS
ncbi:hypothetical protein VTJ04DRAFT_5138 [Mycothermus thermophilus]|uniref:uncharacterized protein n=1 Tax=Humicola insolens TaxID=85995 RepID=UPI003742107D